MGALIDLVADIGEGFGAWTMGEDEDLLKVVSSANIACGFHAGDPRIMDRTVAMCRERGVGIGAHPGFPDLVGFGRRAFGATPYEIETDLIYQMGALAGFAAAHGTTLQHVTPHGRLGNDVVRDRASADAVVTAVHRFDPSLIVVSFPGELIEAAKEAGLRHSVIGFSDRAYQSDGTLVPRGEPGAVIHDEDEVVERVLRLVLEGVVTSIDGVELQVSCDTVLLHGDNEKAVLFANRVRDSLMGAGVRIAGMAEVVDARMAAETRA